MTQVRSACYLFADLAHPCHTELPDNIMLSKGGYLLSPKDFAADLLDDEELVLMYPRDDPPLSKPPQRNTKAKQSPYSPEESQLRIELAAAYRIFAYFGWYFSLVASLTASTSTGPT